MIGAEFRAWDQEEKKMYYNVENTYDWHGYSGDCDCPATCFGEILQDDRFIVMQYTGLRDSKRTEEYPDGQKICVGDIVSFIENSNTTMPEKCFGVIEYKDFFYGINSNYPKSVKSTFDLVIPILVSDIQIIGNIYENPELSNLKSLDI